MGREELYDRPRISLNRMSAYVSLLIQAIGRVCDICHLFPVQCPKLQSRTYVHQQNGNGTCSEDKFGRT